MVPQWLQRGEVAQFVINRLGLRRLANAALDRAPLVRKLPHGTRYRYRTLDSIPLADGIFGKRTYDPGIPPNVRTFADLGCNVGYFVALLADVTGNRALRGIAVDADARMVDETRWVVQGNALADVAAVCGLVASPGDRDVGETRDFFLHPVSIKSSLYAVPEPGQLDKGAWRRTRVPVLDVEALWKERVGDVRCDLLKIDIEGAESEFVTADNPFLRRVDSMIIEIHGWVVGLGEMDERIRALGFDETKELERTEHLLAAAYRRTRAA